MPIPVLASKTGKIELSPVLPEALKSLQVPGSVCHGAAGPFGHLLFQHLAGEDISIRYVNLYFTEEDELSYSSNEQALRLQVSLRNSFYYQLEGLGDFAIHERGFTLNFVPFVRHRLQVRKQGSYTSFSIYYKLEHLLPLQDSFAGLSEFLRKVEAGEAAHFNNSYCIADGNMALMIDNILECSYSGSLRQIYLNSAAMEILVLALLKITGERPRKPAAISKIDVEKIYAAKDLLLGDMSKPLSLTKLATVTGLSPYKLNNGFKAIYGMAVTDWLLEARMERAHRLLQTEEPVNSVARDSGYSHPHAFTLAFKKYFGYTPAFVQKSGKHSGEIPDRET